VAFDGAHARAYLFAGQYVCLDVGDALDGIVDRSESGAAAKTSPKGGRKISALFICELRASHDHAGGAEPTLEAGRF